MQKRRCVHLKIAICDDESTELQLISSLLQDYQQDRKAGFSFHSFSNAMDLLERMKSENYDLLILDVLMPMFNGIQAAHEIRTFDEGIKIIFLTSSPEFAVQSYSVHAYHYLLKPIKKDSFYSLLDNIISDNKLHDEYITVRSRQGIIRISVSKLSFVEVMRKTLFFNMSDGTVYEISATLSEYEPLILQHPQFLRIHRSFIVNLWHMRELDSQGFITINDKYVPVSRRMHLQVKEAYMKSLFSQTEQE